MLCCYNVTTYDKLKVIFMTTRCIGQEKDLFTRFSNARTSFHNIFGNCSGSHKGTKAQRLNMSLSPYLKSLPAIASRSGEAGGEEHNVALIKGY